MNSRSPLSDEAGDRGRRIAGLEKLNQRLACGESDYSRAVGVVERNLRKTEDFAEERHGIREGLYCDSDVRDASPA